MAVVGQNPVANASVASVQTLVAANKSSCMAGKYTGYAAYRNKGGYKIAAECLANKRDAEDIIKTMEHSGLRDRKSTRLNSSHIPLSRMPSSA